MTETLRPTTRHTTPGALTGLGLILAALILLWLPGAAQAATEPPVRHAVEAGDTLGGLAERYASTIPAILAANWLPDPERIDEGQTLLIPLASQPVLRVEVQPHETLSAIARRYRTTPADLRALNQMTARQRLIVGQDLLTPPHPAQPSPALPPGPLTHITLSPDQPRQGETIHIRVQTSQPLSLSVHSLGLPATLLPDSRPNTYWGLFGVHAMQEPGPIILDLHWQAENGETGVLRWPLMVIDGGHPTYNIVLSPEKSELLAPELAEAERQKLDAIWTGPETEPAWQGRFLRPVGDQFPTSAPFAQRRSYNGGPVSSFHSGQDFAAPEGTPVIAPAAGTVILAEPLMVRGNVVIIDHGYGLFTGYWHLAKIIASEGQVIQPGQIIGEVGTTGLSTGNHLHWEMRLHSLAVDPVQWLDQRFH